MHMAQLMLLPLTVGGVAYWLAAFVAWTKLTHVGPGYYLDG